MKRTRRVKKWIITLPHVAIHEAGVYRITAKVSQVSVERIKNIPKHREGTPPDPGEGKDRGKLDTEEDSLKHAKEVGWGPD